MAFKQPEAGDNPLSSKEDLIHQQALETLRAEISAGRAFSQACAALTGIEENLRNLIADDFLKIIIAEEHFGKSRSLSQVAVVLGLSSAEVEAIRDIMLEEVGQEMARQYREEVARTSH